MSRDFILDAVFFLMVPRFADLSIALYVAERLFSASSTFPEVTSLRVSLTASFMVRSRRTLNTRLRRLAACAFFAELVIGIVTQRIPQHSFLARCRREITQYTTKQSCSIWFGVWKGDYT